MRMLRAVAALAALAVFTAVALAWAGRAAYPWDLEWTEGLALGSSWRLAHGEPLYAAPTLAWAPVARPAGHAWGVAALEVLLPSPLAARALGIAGGLLAAGALWITAARRTHDPLLGLGAAALFLGGAHAAGAGLDLARPDGLFVGLVGAGIAAAVRERPGLAGLLLGLAAGVDVTGWIVGGAVLAGLPRGAGRAGAGLALGSVVGIAGVLLAGGPHPVAVVLGVPLGLPVRGADVASGLLELGAGAGLLGPALALVSLGRGRARREILEVGAPMAVGACVGWAAWRFGAAPGPVWIAGIGAASLGVLAARAPFELRRADDRLLGVAALGVGLAALWARGRGAGPDAVLPALWLLVLGGTVALARLPEHLPRLGTGILAVQLAGIAVAGIADPRVPTEADRAAGQRVELGLTRLPAPVWSPYATSLPVRAGHAPSAHALALSELRRSGVLARELAAFDRSVQDGAFGAVITADDPSLGDLSRTRLRTRLHLAGAFAPVSGWPVALDAVRQPEPR